MWLMQWRDRKNEAKESNIWKAKGRNNNAGKSTRSSLDVFANLMNIPAPVEDSVVIVFSEEAKTLSTSIKTAEDVTRLCLPSPGLTNITGAISSAVECIVRADAGSPAHNVLVFLSDGAHNRGPELCSYTLAGMRASFDSAAVRASVIVVGLHRNDTRLGMRVKTALETAPIASLPPVYFASSAREMHAVLHEMTDCLTANLSGGSVRLTLPSPSSSFFQMGCEMNVFLPSDGRAIDVIVKTTDEAPRLLVNDAEVPVVELLPCKDDVMKLISTVLPSIAVRRVADGKEAVMAAVDELNAFLDECEGAFATMEEEVLADVEMGAKSSPAQRLRALKRAKSKTEHQFATARNALMSVLNTLSNDSASQAAFLTGGTRKYASKAMARGGTIGNGTADVAEDIQKLLPALTKALEEDRAVLADQALPESILSNLNAIEQLEEWVAAAQLPLSDFRDLYAQLCSFGLPAYPVRFHANNAVQMDPFATECLELGTDPIDTAYLLFSQQMQIDCMSTAGLPLRGALPLISPVCPRASLVVRRSALYRMYCSVALCQDLFMPNGKQTFAMHAHAFLRAVHEYQATEARIRLNQAVLILYSIRKWWGDYALEGDNVALFRTWWVEWGAITHDVCAHPAMLILMLGALDLGQLAIPLPTGSATTPLTHLLSEALARIFKMRLRILHAQNNGGESACNADTKSLAIEHLQLFFGITPDNSPSPLEDALEMEPTIEAVRETCQPFVEDIWTHGLEDLGVGGEDVCASINKELVQYLRAFKVALGMQTFLSSRDESWDELIGRIEQHGDAPDDVIDFLADALKAEDCADVFVAMEIPSSEREGAAHCLLAQSMLCHCTSTRRDLPPFDANTLRTIIVDLRMAHYFVKCKLKRSIYLDLIGDATAAQASEASVTAFEAMIGRHTHGLNKQQFWGMLTAARKDPAKRFIFLCKSNDTVEGYL